MRFGRFKAHIDWERVTNKVFVMKKKVWLEILGQKCQNMKIIGKICSF